MNASPALARVARGRLCSGCGACAAAAPGKVSMAMEPPGWLRPRQTAPLSAGEEAAVAASCPGLSLTSPRPEGARPDPIWGPIVACRTGHATDPALRRAASSGGALSAVLTHLLETGEVDAVVQIAADPDDPVGNRVTTSRSAAEIASASGSRYAPSAPLAALEPHLSGTERIAFVGKPCDVAALRALALVDSRIDARIPWMLSFFCAGVPSRGGALALLQRMEAPVERVTSFRYRGDGWPGHARATLDDGGERRTSYQKSWGEVLSKHIQFRCKLCVDGVAEGADIAFADAWETDEAGYPLFEESEGHSLVLSRTLRGEAAVTAAEAAGRLATAPLDTAAIDRMQPGQLGRRSALAGRLAGARLLLSPVPRYRGYALFRVAGRRGGLRWVLRNFLGTARRVLGGRY